MKQITLIHSQNPQDKMGEPTAKTLIKSLEVLLATGVPHRTHTGLCSHLDIDVVKAGHCHYGDDKSYRMVEHYAHGWPEHSGCIYLPVPTNKVGSGVFDATWDKTTDEGAARWRLVQHVLDGLRRDFE
jgi:hypothetical protein